MSRAGLYSLRPSAFGEAAGEADMRLLQRAKLCFFGEIHSQPAAVELQCRTVQAMLGSMATPSASSSSSSLHIVFEHFNFEMQPLLDDFSAGRLSLEELAAGAELVEILGRCTTVVNDVLADAHAAVRAAAADCRPLRLSSALAQRSEHRIYDS